MALTGFSGWTQILQKASNTTAHTIKNPGQTGLDDNLQEKIWMQRPLLDAKEQFMNCGNTESCHVSTEGGGRELSLQPLWGGWHCWDTWDTLGTLTGTLQGHSVRCRVLQDTSTPCRAPSCCSTNRERQEPATKALPEPAGPSGAIQAGDKATASWARTAGAAPAASGGDSGTSGQPQARLSSWQSSFTSSCSWPSMAKWRAHSFVRIQSSATRRKTCQLHSLSGFLKGGGSNWIVKKKKIIFLKIEIIYFLKNLSLHSSLVLITTPTTSNEAFRFFSSKNGIKENKIRNYSWYQLEAY